MIKRHREIRKLILRVRHRHMWWVYYYRLDYFVPRFLFMAAVAGAVAGLGYWLAG